MINYKYTKNTDDVFLRSVFAALSEELTDMISYVQIESDTEKKVIKVPIYMSATGQERFLQYYFNDKNYQVCADEKVVEGSFDVVPRGILKITNSTITSGDNTSPYGQGEVYEIDTNGYIKSYWATITGIPLSMSFNLEIHTNNQSEQMKIYQSLIKSLYWKRKFNFLFEGAIVPVLAAFPDDVERNKNLEFKNGQEKDRLIISLGLDVETYLPIIKNKKFKGERIEQFNVNYDLDQDQIFDEQQIVNHTGSIQGRISIEDTNFGVIDTVTLTNDNDSDYSLNAELNDGYFLFQEVPARVGYRVRTSDGLTLHKKISVTPGEKVIFDRELFLD